MKRFLNRLQAQSEENPMLAIGVGVTAITVIVQLLNSVVNLYGRRTWSKEVSRRAKNLK